MRLLTALQRKIIAIAAASLLSGGPSPAKIVLLGVIMHAEHAHVGEAAASPGSTIFEGDRLSTEAGGMLRVAIPALTLQLGAQSSAVITYPAAPKPVVLAELGSGTLIFSAAPAGDVVVKVNEALVKPFLNEATVAQIHLVNQKELRIYAERGAVEFSYHGESETIPDGNVCRVLLDPSEAEAEAASRSSQGNKPPARHPKFIVIAIVAGALAIAIPVIIHELESPDRPGTNSPKPSQKP